MNNMTLFHSLLQIIIIKLQIRYDCSFDDDSVDIYGRCGHWNNPNHNNFVMLPNKKPSQYIPNVSSIFHLN